MLCGETFWGGKPGDFGVGCDDRGPLPGVGGRGVSGGLSSGAGIEVPSVREKLMGVSVSGFHSNLPDGIVGRVEGRSSRDDQLMGMRLIRRQSLEEIDRRK